MKMVLKNQQKQTVMNNLFSVSEVKLTYKSKVTAADRPQIISSHTAYDILLSNWSDQIEMV